jgi:WhiB family transcriptional regulator, redox-sensing transcriptional regulator
MSNLRRLPAPIADVWDWQLRGRCRSLDTSVFFHPDAASGPLRRQRETQAKAICPRCPVRPQCAAHALTVREPYGIWGGLTQGQRLRLLAIGWEDLADRHRTRVDIARLQARLDRTNKSTMPEHGDRPPASLS